MLKRVETVKTNIPIYDFIKALVLAWKNVYGKLPQKKNIGVIFAQWSLETGQGEFCWNYNIGNSKAVDIPNEIVEFCILKGVWEIVKGKKIILPPEDPGSWFRSFRTLEEGVAHHFNFLRNKRYKTSWVAVEEGNVAKFANLLKKAGYYTDSEENYAKGMGGYFNNFMKGKTFDAVIKDLEEAAKVVVIPEVVISDKEEVPNSIEATVLDVEKVSTTETVANDIKANVVKPKFNLIQFIVNFFKFLFKIKSK